MDYTIRCNIEFEKETIIGNGINFYKIDYNIYINGLYYYDDYFIAKANKKKQAYKVIEKRLKEKLHIYNNMRNKNLTFEIKKISLI